MQRKDRSHVYQKNKHVPVINLVTCAILQQTLDLCTSSGVEL